MAGPGEGCPGSRSNEVGIILKLPGIISDTVIPAK